MTREWSKRGRNNFQYELWGRPRASESAEEQAVAPLWTQEHTALGGRLDHYRNFINVETKAQAS